MRHADDIISGEAAWRERGGCDMRESVWGEEEETERREQTWLEELCNRNPTQQTRKSLFLPFLSK